MQNMEKTKKWYEMLNWRKVQGLRKIPGWKKGREKGTGFCV